MKQILIPALAALLLAGCDTNSKWEVSGKIAGADSIKMLVQASDNGRWYTLDTVTTAGDGSYSYSHDATPYPDIFRLTLDGKSVYFPVDSIDRITVNSSASDFDRDFTVSGSPEAERMMQVESKMRQQLPDSVLKRDLAQVIISQPSGIVSYYIINRQVNGRPLFNPADRKDIRMIGAVANAYDAERPSDPRTAYLRQLYLGNRQTVAPADTIHATQMGYIDLDLTDSRGTAHTLASVADTHKVVILDFTAYGADGSVAYNSMLAEVYRKYSSQGLAIYQVAFDPDEYQWKQSARNLPWITVYCPPTQANKVMSTYNVGSLPTAYIIADGVLVKRVADMSELAGDVAAYL